MKKCYFLLLLLVLCTKGFAQTVFAPDGAVWHFEHIADFEPSGQNYSRYAKEKDTMYFGHLCAKIPGKKIVINSRGSGYDTTELETQYTYTNGDTVFYYNHVFDRFLVLYRFDVKAGDTITYHHPFKMSPRYDTVFKIVIDSVKVDYIDGLPVRTIRSTPVEPVIFTLDYLTERIGPIEAFSMQGYNYKLTFPEGGGLRCYSDALIDTNVGVRKYDCEELASLSVANVGEEDSWSIFPNPAQDILTIAWNNVSNAHKAHVHVSDVFGKEQPVSSALSASSITVNFQTLPPGTYCLAVSSDYGVLFRTRFVRQ